MSCKKEEELKCEDVGVFIGEDEAGRMTLLPESDEI